MSSAAEKRVIALADDLAKVEPHGQEQQAIYGFIVGAIYAMRRALTLGFADRTGPALPADYSAELMRVALGLVITDVVSEQKWLAGFYFNSALQRVHAAGERLGAYVGILDKRDRRAILPEVWDEVNRLKHEVTGVLPGRGCTPAQAISALSLLVDIARKMFGPP